MHGQGQLQHRSAGAEVPQALLEETLSAAQELQASLHSRSIPAASLPSLLGSRSCDPEVKRGRATLKLQSLLSPEVALGQAQVGCSSEIVLVESKLIC